MEDDNDLQFNKKNKKEYLDIIEDDTIAKKKNKKKSKRQQDSNDESSEAEMEFEGRKQIDTTSKKNKRNSELDYSLASGSSKSINKSTVSKKRKKTLEEYLIPYCGKQFYDLVINLSKEQQAEYELDSDQQS